jgi:hypothetical protein
MRAASVPRDVVRGARGPSSCVVPLRVPCTLAFALGLCAPTHSSPFGTPTPPTSTNETKNRQRTRMASGWHSIPAMRGWVCRLLGERMQAGNSGDVVTAAELSAALTGCSNEQVATRHAATLLRHSDADEVTKVVRGGGMALAATLALGNALLRCTQATAGAGDLLAALLPEVAAVLGEEEEEEQQRRLQKLSSMERSLFQRGCLRMLRRARPSSSSPRRPPSMRPLRRLLPPPLLALLLMAPRRSRAAPQHIPGFA